MEHLVRSCYRKPGGYTFAKKAKAAEITARLASNENPEPPPHKAARAARRALREANRYPDEKSEVLAAALRGFYGNHPFVTGVGMDGVIETTLRTIVEPGETVAVSTPTFSFYSLAAVSQGARVVSVPRETDFSVSAGRFVRAVKKAKLSFLCSPNNPTGNATPAGAVQEILEKIDGVLFLDNAYVEFSDTDYLYLLKKFDNLILGRTFSKAYSLAGLRIGYAFVPAWFRPYYLRAGTPFVLNMVSEAAAAAALSDRAHATRYIIRVRKWRKRLEAEVKYPILPSDANFVMVDVSPYKSDEVADLLLEKGVIVRSCRSFSGLPDRYIRVSIGEDWENERFIAEINNL